MNNSFLRSFKGQLLLGMGATILFSIMIMSFVFYNLFSSILEKNSSRELKTVTDLKQSELNIFIQDIHNDLRSLTQIDEVQRLLKAPSNKQYALSLNKNSLLKVIQEHLHIYVIEAKTGRILFQSFANGLQGKSVFVSELSNSKLGKLVKTAVTKNQPVISGFQNFEPEGNNLPAIAIPAPEGAVIVGFLTDSNQKLKHLLFNNNNTIKLFLFDRNKQIAGDHELISANIISDILNSNDPAQTINFTANNGQQMKATYNPIQFDNLEMTSPWYLLGAIPNENFVAPLNSLRNYLFLLCLIIVLISGLVIYLYGSRISNPLVKISQQLEQVSHGNLNVDIPLIKQQNEMGLLTQNLKKTTERLKQQMNEIIEHTNSLATSSNEVSATVAQITASSTETASAITQTASSAEEVEQLAKNFNEKTKESLIIGEKTVEATNQGTESFNTIERSIQDVQTQMEQIANRVLELSKYSQDIGEITEAVKEIAEQSNILAINASIEATKAGESGKGFAVVANEVRNLAEQSKKSTQQIQKILNTIQDAVGKTVIQVEQGTKTIQSSAGAVDQAQSSMNKMVEYIEKLIHILNEIADFSKEQLTGTAQIKEAMENIKEATNQNVDGMRQLEEVIENLKETSENLKQLVSTYQLN